jgi:hypothetical protein
MEPPSRVCPCDGTKVRAVYAARPAIAVPYGDCATVSGPVARCAFQPFRGGTNPGQASVTDIPARPEARSRCALIGAPSGHQIQRAESVICPVSIEVHEVSEGGLEPSGALSRRPRDCWAGAIRPAIAGLPGSPLSPVSPRYLESVPRRGAPMILKPCCRIKPRSGRSDEPWDRPWKCQNNTPDWQQMRPAVAIAPSTVYTMRRSPW